MRLYSLPLASSQYDYAHRVLALLYCTSRGAALSGGAGPLPPSLLLERLEREAERAILGEPSYLTDTSSTSGSWAEVPWSPASELSEWSDGGAAEAVATAPAAGEQQQPQTMMDGEAAGVDGGAAMDVDAQRQQQQQQQQQKPSCQRRPHFRPWRCRLSCWLATRRRQQPWPPPRRAARAARTNAHHWLSGWRRGAAADIRNGCWSPASASRSRSWWPRWAVALSNGRGGRGVRANPPQTLSSRL